jgi:hypothetical protein
VSIYEDVKKALTDFLVPEMRAEMDVIKERISQNERRAEERHQAVMREIGWRFDLLRNSLELERRVGKLEQREEEKRPS